MLLNQKVPRSLSILDKCIGMIMVDRMFEIRYKPLKGASTKSCSESSLRR